MEKIEYQVLTLDQLVDKDYIEIAIGKKRRKKFKDSSIFFKSNVFSLLNGVIWENYREYSPTTTNAITKNDWLRIVKGLEESMIMIEKSLHLSDIKEALYIRPYANLSDNGDFTTFKKDVLALVANLKDFVLLNLEDEKYITICV